MRACGVAARLLIAGELAVLLGLAGQTVAQSPVSVNGMSFSPPVAGNYEFIPSVQFANPDGVQLVADMYLPRGSGPFPGVVYLHGGGWRAGNRRQMRRQAAYMAEHGMVGMAIEYRLAPKYPYPDSVEDAKAAVKWLRAHAAKYHVDPTRIGAVGSSAGGYLAAELGVTSRTAGAGQGANVEAVVAFNGIYNLAAMPPGTMVSDFLGKSCVWAPILCREASPMSIAGVGEPPFLVLHGTADKTAPYSQAAAFVEKLKAAGVDVHLFTAAGAPHTFWAEKKWFDPTEKQMREFLDRVLMSKH